MEGNSVRKTYMAAVGVRKDGVVIKSYNGCGRSDGKKPSAHAEARLCRKLGKGAIVYVGRVRRDNGAISMAKPCARCEAVMRNRGVAKVYYTITEGEWGCLEF